MNIGNLVLPDFPVMLAPMEDVTDASFRRVCREYGADLVFTEFISSEGLIRSAVKSQNKLFFHESERPVAIQIFGHDLVSLREATAITEQANPDIIDINWGCPVRKVISKGAGAAMLKDPEKMIQLTEAVVNSTRLPVSVKTRIGWDHNSIIIQDLAERLQDTGIKAISVHGRTGVQMYKGQANWDIIGRIKKNKRIRIPVIGNGDITTAEQAGLIRNKYTIDGIMIGRGALGNPWLFRDIKEFLSGGRLNDPPDIKERVTVLRKLLYYSIELKGESKAIIEIRKHYGGIFKTLPDFKGYKNRLMTTQKVGDLENILNEISDFYS